MDKTSVKSVMLQAIEQARETMNKDIGGPFGAAIIDREGTILSVASNSVLNDFDATAHAEINAIRQASKKIGSHDLKGCTIVTTAYPCPMCLGAIIWANIDQMIYGCRPKDAEAIGFRDQFIYTFIESGNNDDSILKIDEQYRKECLELFKEYHQKTKTIY